MQGRPVIGTAVASPVMLVGQAPGVKEVEVGKPFAWTAGRTLFGWFAHIGLDEAAVRSRVYLAAVCRCFPGKRDGGGDRLPSPEEVANCSGWLNAEIRILRPRLVIPVGKLAIAQFLDAATLDVVVGRKYVVHFVDCSADVIALPHPSGASVWHRVEPGRMLLKRALRLIATHPAWKALVSKG